MADTRPVIRLATAPDLVAVAGCVEAAYLPYLQRMDGPPAPMLDDHAASIEHGCIPTTRDAAWHGFEETHRAVDDGYHRVFFRRSL